MGAPEKPKRKYFYKAEGYRCNPPQHALEDRDRRFELAASHISTPNEIVLGDPPPWKRAGNKTIAHSTDIR
jgi:hypothetical protein